MTSKLDEAQLGELGEDRTFHESRCGEIVSKWPATYELCFEKQTHPVLIGYAEDIALHSLRMAMSYLRVESDMEAYTSHISRAALEALPRLQSVLDRMARDIPAIDPLVPPAAAFTQQTTWVFASSVLAADEALIEQARKLVEHPRLVSKDGKNKHVERWYALLTSSGKRLEEILAQADSTRADFFKGFGGCVQPILDGDQAAFDSLLSERAEEYAKRRSKRQFFEHGEGKYHNRITFDAWGVVYCKLAMRHGMRINIDSPHFPRDAIEFSVST